MSKSEILAELPNLTPDDRDEVLARLWDIEESDALRRGPGVAEKTMLDRELADYERKPDAGSPWLEAEQRLRKRS